MTIILLDSISLLAAAAAVLFLASGWKHLAGTDVRMLLAALLTLNLFYVACMWMEWVGLTAALDKYEDFIGALMPMFWAFVFYAHIQRGMNLEIRKSEENLRVTLDSIGDGVIATTRRGTVSRMNPMAEKLTGWTMEEALNRPLTDVFNIINARTGEPAVNPVTRVLETGHVMGLANHTKLIARDGTEYHIGDAAAPIRDSAGRIIGMVLVFRNVTEEYRLRERITENEERMKLALEGADLGTWDWNLQTGEVRFNRRWAEIVGFRPEEIAPHVSTWENLIHPDDVQHVMDALTAHLAGRTDVYETEHRLKHKSGQWCWVLDRGRVIARAPDGQPQRACGTHLDITARKRLEDQIRRAHRMEAIGRLAGGVAHDFNNLLSPILGYGEMLVTDPAITGDRRRFLNEILHAGFRARELVRQLLTFSRKQTLEFRPVDINETIRDFEKLLRRTIPEDIEIRTALSRDIRVIKGDVGQIEQIIMNLAVNAADAMPDGGRLSIETAVCELDAEYATTHSTVVPGWYVMLAISDTGCGMDPDTSERVFEPFFTTKGELGTGLGLSTVFGIVKQHGGNIWLYSEPGRGTTFKIFLPVADDVPVGDKPVERPASAVRGTETILLVEDNDPVRLMVHAVLEQQGYRVLAARGSDEALKILSGYDGPVHLLLTDVVMPGTNGRELYEKAVSQRPGLKVLYMSGYTGDVITFRGVLNEGVQFIQKPFSTKDLAHKVREVLIQDS
ncbi:MAG: PAS domain-containing protein [Thermodesulfobacteriota bacterium]